VNEHVLEMIPAYVLEALDPQEAQQVQSHLSVCAACREELAHYQQSSAALAWAASSRMPPVHLRAAILDQARRDRAGHDSTANTGWQARLLAPLMRPGFALGALAIILALLIANLLLSVELRQARVALSSQPLMVEMTPAGEVYTAGGVMIISQGGRYGVLVVDGLPALDESQQYQLWLIREGQRDNGGVFSVWQNGYGYLQVENPRPLTDYEGFGLTVEPAGGSPAPTGERVLGGSL